MEFMVVFVHDDDADSAARALVREDFRFTRVPSTSGLLGEENATFLIGVESDRVGACIEVFQNTCRERSIAVPGSLLEGTEIDPDDLDEKHRPVTVKIGGATGFVLEVAREFRT